MPFTPYPLVKCQKFNSFFNELTTGDRTMRNKLSKLDHALALTLSLAACGGDIPNGKYCDAKGKTCWEFSGDKVTRHFGKGAQHKGTYIIDENGWFLFAREDGHIYKILFSLEGNKLLLGSTEYTKQ